MDGSREPGSRAAGSGWGSVASVRRKARRGHKRGGPNSLGFELNTIGLV